MRQWFARMGPARRGCTIVAVDRRDGLIAHRKHSSTTNRFRSNMNRKQSPTSSVLGMGWQPLLTDQARDFVLRQSISVAGIRSLVISLVGKKFGSRTVGFTASGLRLWRSMLPVDEIFETVVDSGKAGLNAGPLPKTTSRRSPRSARRWPRSAAISSPSRRGAHDMLGPFFGPTGW